MFWPIRISMKVTAVEVNGQQLGYHYEIWMHSWSGTLYSIGHGQFLLSLMSQFKLGQSDSLVFVYVRDYQWSWWEQVSHERWVSQLQLRPRFVRREYQIPEGAGWFTRRLSKIYKAGEAKAQRMKATDRVVTENATERGEVLEVGHVRRQEDFAPILEFGWRAPDESCSHEFLVVGEVGDREIQPIYEAVKQAVEQGQPLEPATVLQWHKPVFMRGHDGLIAEIFTGAVTPDQMHRWLGECSKKFGFKVG